MLKNYPLPYHTTHVHFNGRRVFGIFISCKFSSLHDFVEEHNYIVYAAWSSVSVFLDAVLQTEITHFVFLVYKWKKQIVYLLLKMGGWDSDEFGKLILRPLLALCIRVHNRINSFFSKRTSHPNVSQFCIRVHDRMNRFDSKGTSWKNYPCINTVTIPYYTCSF